MIKDDRVGGEDSLLSSASFRKFVTIFCRKSEKKSSAQREDSQSGTGRIPKMRLIFSDREGLMDGARFSRLIIRDLNLVFPLVHPLFSF